MLKFLMAQSCSLERFREDHILILCDSDASKAAHKELFRYKDDLYKVLETENVFYQTREIIDLLNSNDLSNPVKLHITFNWSNILKIFLWQPEAPSTGDIFLTLRNFGLTSDELSLFKNFDRGDIFFSLYYGKRFDILRKVCHGAKRQIERHLRNNFVKTDVHLIAEDTGRIVASTL